VLSLELHSRPSHWHRYLGAARFPPTQRRRNDSQHGCCGPDSQNHHCRQHVAVIAGWCHAPVSSRMGSSFWRSVRRWTALST